MVLYHKGAYLKNILLNIKSTFSKRRSQKNINQLLVNDTFGYKVEQKNINLKNNKHQTKMVVIIFIKIGKEDKM